LKNAVERFFREEVLEMTKSLKFRMALITLAVVAVANLAGLAGEGKAGVISGARELRVSEPTLFAGKHLDEGLYRLDWEMTVGTTRAPVRLFKGKRLLFAAEGEVSMNDSASPQDSLAYTRHASGKLELSEIRFAGSRLTISLRDATLASGQP